MSFQSVWGFDPDEVIRSQELSRRESNFDGSAYECDENPQIIPADVDTQIYELHRMFGL
jgi:hypothetical protein